MYSAFVGAYPRNYNIGEGGNSVSSQFIPSPRFIPILFITLKSCKIQHTLPILSINKIRVYPVMSECSSLKQSRFNVSM